MSIADKYGRTPLDLADELRDMRVIYLLNIHR